MPAAAAATAASAGRGRAAGSSSARAAHSRNRDANSAEPPTSCGDELLELVGLEHEQLGAGRLGVGVGHPHDDAVVAGHRGAVDAEPLADARR